MATSSWVATEDWEVLILGEKRMPGVARVEVTIASGLDVQKPKGAKRAKIRDTGTPPASLSIELEFNADELAQLEDAIGLLRPRSASGPRQPLAITHPQARLWGIAVVVVGSIGAPQPRAGGSYVLRFDATEWAPEPKKVKKADAKPHGDFDAVTGRPRRGSAWDATSRADELRPGAAGAAQSNLGRGPLLPSGTPLL